MIDSYVYALNETPTIIPTLLSLLSAGIEIFKLVAYIYIIRACHIYIKKNK